MSGLPKYQASIDRSNKNNSHTLSIDFIEINGHGQPLEILEVGCSTGYFGSALQSLGHSVIGVEMDEASSSIARSHLGEVHCCTIQDYFLKNPQKRFDVITFGDVLEHLTDPESVLKSTLNHLKPGGRLVASIPNVTHASIRCMLLQGDWTYSDLGILERNAIRHAGQKWVHRHPRPSSQAERTARCRNVRTDPATRVPQVPGIHTR
jgi:2-polyprenyl-3-methyl-5-hydroxy-6-metoxy-1,4-benzoquinol methylase